ncbi:MAG TPA: acyl carrier protein [Streptosporangiaceae bacterium]|jgi:yersiniabactin nonribosomal peptide synthetase|nr:acyl carrier protein [Streptosporangiaceae bacterium]
MNGEKAEAAEVGAGQVEAVLAAEWQRVLKTTDTEPDADFFRLGGNSMDAVELMTAVEERLGITFPLETLFMEGTFGALVRACSELGATA